MLEELLVRDLGVIEEASILFGPAMTAVTGETGAGKTLVVEAIELLVGGRADATLVREGAAEAVVEGRFWLEDADAGGDGGSRDRGREVILRRVVPRRGRSRAYIDGALATAAELTAWGERLVDLHGQHDHQSLLHIPAQRDALDRFGRIDLQPRRQARTRVAEIEEQLAALGGDERERAREVDLLRYQVDELIAAGLEDPDEDRDLERQEDELGDALAHREAAASAVEALAADRGATDLVAAAIAALGDRGPFSEAAARLTAVGVELADLVTEIRGAGEAIEDDPVRLEAVRARRHQLRELGRKYGEDLAEMMTFRDEATARLEALEARHERALALEAERDRAQGELRRVEADLAAARRAAAPELAQAIEANLATLAMGPARLTIEVGADAGDEVSLNLAANAGSSPRPLAKVASGGELARTMLALRLVLSEAPPTLVFDEVDAGIGGTAAVAVGRALAELGRRHQVLVVTHLAQVAAHADHQLVVDKKARRGRTTTSVTPITGEDREVELARMLSGSPASDTARHHARELLGDGRRASKSQVTDDGRNQARGALG